MVAGGQKVLAVDVTYPAPVQAVDATDQLNITSSTAAPGSPVCGVVFTAPASGRVRVHINGVPRIVSPATGATYLGAVVRAGAVIGSGTLVFDGLGAEPGCRILVQGYVGYLQAAASTLVEGLTAGAQYNVRAEHLVGVGTQGQILGRAVGVDPLP